MSPRRLLVPDVSHVERVYAEVKSRILDGTYRPGSPLAEVTLAERHGTSRTPVREVLSRLLQAGWVERIPNRGYSVAPITLKSIRDAFEVRRLLEGAACASAALQASDGEIASLHALAAVETDIEAARFARAEAANRAFHLAVAAASHNHMAAELIEHCMAQMNRLLALGISARPLQQGTREEHQVIVDAIARRDAAAARTAMEVHLDRCQALLTTALVQGAIREISA